MIYLMATQGTCRALKNVFSVWALVALTDETRTKKS